MQVNEIFYSIQGEGRHAGLPATFVRLQGCPIGCPFCDTKKSWPTDHGRALNLTPAQIMDSIAAMQVPYVSLLGITGGEPFYGQNGEELQELVNTINLRSAMAISIETSGTCFPKTTPAFTCPVDVTISPKYRVGEEDFLPVRRELFNLPGRTDIKFLVDDTPQTIERIRNFIRDYGPLMKLLSPESRIFLQPVDFGREDVESAEKTARAAVQAVELCKVYGWRLSLQLHKYLNIP